MSEPSDPVTGAPRVRITVNADRSAVEALQLELRRLAREHGLGVKRVTVARAADEPAAGADEAPEGPSA